MEEFEELKYDEVLIRQAELKTLHKEVTDYSCHKLGQIIHAYRSYIDYYNKSNNTKDGNNYKEIAEKYKNKIQIFVNTGKI